MMIDTIELYILILVEVTLSLIGGHKAQESKTFCVNYFTKFHMNLDVIWCAVEDYWWVEPHTHFVS